MCCLQASFLRDTPTPWPVPLRRSEGLDGMKNLRRTCKEGFLGLNHLQVLQGLRIIAIIETPGGGKLPPLMAPASLLGHVAAEIEMRLF